MPYRAGRADGLGAVVGAGGGLIDAPTGITKIYVERILVPHHVDPGTVDYVYAGATGARFNALMSGAVDATVLLPPFSFSAEETGYRNLGLVADYAGDLP